MRSKRRENRRRERISALSAHYHSMCVPILIYVIISATAYGAISGPLVCGRNSQWTLAVAIYYDSTSLAEAWICPTCVWRLYFISLVPAIIFFFYQKTLIEGIQMGAIKG
ncbi:MAG: hypothetical protein ACLRTQ_04400 [Candidatus Borkfalkia sp.]